MNQYEVMYVIDPALEDSARAELITDINRMLTGETEGMTFIHRLD